MIGAKPGSFAVSMHDAIQSRPIWMPEQRYGARYGWLHKPAVHVLLVCDMLFNSRLYRVLEPAPLQPVLLGTCAALILLYAGIAWLRLYILPVMLLISGFALIFYQMHVFSGITHIPIETNSLFQYIWIFTFIVYVAVCRDGHGNFLAEKVLFYSTVYTFLYVLIGTLHKIGILSSSNLAGIVLTDIERGDRLYSYGIAVNFAWFAWLHRAKTQTDLKSVLMICICALAFYYMMSRFAAIILLTLSAAYIFGLSLKSIRFLSLAIFVAAAVPNLYGLYDPSWNPFALFAGDSSGSFRAFEYELARMFIWQDPIFGFGIAPTPQAASFLLNEKFFSGSDLGPIGVWFDYGIIGLVLFLLATTTACRAITGVRANLATALSLSGCFLAAYGCLAPLILTGGSTIFAVLLAVQLGTRTPRRSAQLPWSHARQLTLE